MKIWSKIIPISFSIVIKLLLCILLLRQIDSDNSERLNQLLLSTDKNQQSELCRRGIRGAVIDYNRKHFPAHSFAWNKTYSLLQQAKKHRAIVVIPFFPGVTSRLLNLLREYGVNATHFEDIDTPFYDMYQPGLDVVFEMSYFATVSKNPRSSIYIKKGEENLHRRIIVQSEQLDGRYAWQVLPFITECNNSANCTLWDYSDLHLRILESREVNFSSFLVPLMLNADQDSTKWYVSSPSERPRDFVFYGTLQRRRLDFHKLLLGETKIKSNMGLETRLEKLTNSYNQAKICGCVHIKDAISAGEYHRLSQVVHHGCVPLFEKFSDIVAIQEMELCGGVQFVEFNQMIPMIYQILESMKNDTANQWLHFINTTTSWWRQQLKDIDTLLVDLFPP